MTFEGFAVTLPIAVETELPDTSGRKADGVAILRLVEKVGDDQDVVRWSPFVPTVESDDLTFILQVIDLDELPIEAAREAVLLKHYTVGTTIEGADAYPPLMLLKAFLLQKWFRIHPETSSGLENQINDRISFKNFLGLSFNKPSPDHSTFSRFRGRLSKEAMNKINNTVLQQFSQKGLAINEGVAVDARLVQSANRPISNEEIKKLKREKRDPGGKDRQERKTT